MSASLDPVMLVLLPSLFMTSKRPFVTPGAMKRLDVIATLWFDLFLKPIVSRVKSKREILAMLSFSFSSSL